MTPAPLPRRATLRAPVSLSGASLFTATPCTLTIAPADPAPSPGPHPGAGIRFRLHDHESLAHIASLSTDPIHPAFATLPPRCTCLRTPSGQIGTVEHLLAALAALGVTDAIVTLDAPELPIFDGSSLPFVRAIRSVGMKPLDAPIEPITPSRPLRVESEDAGASITIEPSDTPSYTYTLDYGPDSPIAPATAHWAGDPDRFEHEIAPARTFCLEREAQAMRQLGLFEHLSPQDMLVFGPRGPIDNTLRFPDEPARHKLLDLIGDLALAGRPIRAKITAVRSGHALNHAAARALLDAVK